MGKIKDPIRLAAFTRKIGDVTFIEGPMNVVPDLYIFTNLLNNCESMFSSKSEMLSTIEQMCQSEDETIEFYLSRRAFYPGLFRVAQIIQYFGKQRALELVNDPIWKV